MMDRTATEVSFDDMERAIEYYRRDIRFHALADSCVGFAMQEHGPIDPERADKAAHDIARAATVLLLSRIYTDDDEMKALRTERDRYKALAESYLTAVPPRFIVPTRYLTPNLQLRLSGA